ncbi:MAG: glycosyltransferase family 9 protein [Candidatus Omnitrophota bacterium]|nr:glycosyltransferase family 9 protein [Candidatus Omnitrophota bacterium]
MNILIINPFGIGDVIFSTPLVAILKMKYPESFIGYICNKRAYEVLKTNPNLDKMFLYEKDDYRHIWKRSKTGCLKEIFYFLDKIRKEKFDLVIDLSLGYQYSMLMKLIGIKDRIGFNYRNRGRFLTRKIDIEGFHEKHVIEYYLDLLRLIDIDISGYDAGPKVYTAASQKGPADRFLEEHAVTDKDMIIGVVAGCGASWGADAVYRRWDGKKFALLSDMLMKRYGARILLLGDHKDADVCRDIEAFTDDKVINLCGRTSMGEFVEYLTRCRMVVTNDGGPLHTAVGLGVPTVSIFGPVDEVVYGPYKSDVVHRVVSKKELPCRPCYKRFKFNKCDNRLCLDSITVDDVMKACEEVIAAGKEER